MYQDTCKVNLVINQVQVQKIKIFLDLDLVLFLLNILQQKITIIKSIKIFTIFKITIIIIKETIIEI